MFTNCDPTRFTRKARLITLTDIKRENGYYINDYLNKIQKIANMLSMNNINFLKSPNDLNMEIAKRVSVRRKEKKITQVQLATTSDVSLGSIKRFERTGEISLSSLIKIAFALGCEDDFDELFSKKGYSSIQEVINEQN